MNEPTPETKPRKLPRAGIGCLAVIVLTFGSMIGSCVFDTFPSLQKVAEPIVCNADEKLTESIQLRGR